MLYLPRLFVYHSEVPVGSPQSETFKLMERRLLRAIINPAMIVTWVFGLWLAWKGFAFQGGWLHAKIALVLVDVRRARLSVRRGPPFRRGPQRKAGAPLADRQRDPHIVDDRYRDPGDREAVLSERLRSNRALLFARPRR